MRLTRFLELIQLPVNTHSALHSVVCCCGHLLALGFFQDFGPSRDPGKPPVDWVEGVAIIVATFVVCAFQLSPNVFTLTAIFTSDGWLAQ